MPLTCWPSAFGFASRFDRSTSSEPALIVMIAFEFEGEAISSADAGRYPG